MRPPLETRAQVEEALAACRTRRPRLALVEEALARAVLPAVRPKEPLPQWVRLLARFPKAGSARVASLEGARKKGNLKPGLKAQLAWIAARHDRAWYALCCARKQLRALGFSEEQIYALDSPGETCTAAERAVFAFVRKLTVAPASVVDADIAGLLKYYRDTEVAELVYSTANAAFFNRVTEACGLQLESE